MILLEKDFNVWRRKKWSKLFPNSIKVVSDVRVCWWKVEFRESHTHLATAVNASSTLRPDRALVSMKGTPNSCTVTENHELFKRLHHLRYTLNTFLTGSEIVWKHKGCGIRVTAVLRGRGNFLVLLRDLVQRWWMCLHPFPQQRNLSRATAMMNGVLFFTPFFSQAGP